MACQRYKISYEYLGENFSGSQKQPDKRTVQGELEKALCTLIKTNISVIPSGRCDVKVSAKYQTAHFDTPKGHDLGYDTMEKFQYHLNCLLPDDLKVLEIAEVKPDFHAQKQAKYKHYRYTIQNDPVASVFLKNVLFYPYFKLDVDKINQMLSYLVGRHDFSAFKSSSDNPYNDCTIYFARAKREIIERHEFIFIDIVGNRFLYNMIRIITGDILAVLRHNLELTLIQDWLEGKTRTFSPNKVKGEGLCLEYVGYDDVENYIQNLLKEGK